MSGSVGLSASTRHPSRLEAATCGVKLVSKRDDKAASFYENPENRQVTGQGHKRSAQVPRLTTHVPIRFSAAVIERVKELASEDGKTVSSWIRDVVDQEVLRREGSRTVGVVVTLSWHARPTTMSSTIGSGADKIDDLQELVG